MNFVAEVAILKSWKGTFFEELRVSKRELKIGENELNKLTKNQGVARASKNWGKRISKINNNLSNIIFLTVNNNTRMHQSKKLR